MNEVFWSLNHILISKGYDNPILHRHLAKHLIISMNKYVKYDDRICHILEQISKMEGIYEGTISILCDEVYLSRSRVSHLFKKQVGVSLSNYLIFEKMRKAYTYVAVGENITTASVKAGFSSSSHFSNVCKKMFGLTFTDFFKTSILIEIK